ncbi:branched-chain amino acid ABC transporter permease [Desulfobacula sp.]|uniref:branched-chain amino acid ABC transporter permease n=1 Tax=Desulfobacula sp. TaxID=2593537 RepID=UPI00262205F4|nr:branched-chain amino acid ABC transporter permease [Desulfobacula sp.]
MEIIITGILLGGAYALIAVGLTIQYGVARIMNLATGETLVASCFCTFWMFNSLKINPILGIFLIAPAAFILNWAIYSLLLLPLVRRAKNKAMLEVDSILATFGILFLLEGLMLVGFGGEYFSYSFLSTSYTIAGTAYGLNRIVAFLAAVLITGTLYVFLTHTRYGTSVRAVAVDPAAAGLVAINVDRVSAFAFALGGVVTAAGGTLLSTFYTFNASMGVVFTMKALIIVIMGGVGDVRGAVIAALILGIAETATATLIDPGLTIAATYFLFILILLFRPQGLFGRQTT